MADEEAADRTRVSCLVKQFVPNIALNQRVMKLARSLIVDVYLDTFDFCFDNTQLKNAIKRGKV